MEEEDSRRGHLILRAGNHIVIRQSITDVETGVSQPGVVGSKRHAGLVDLVFFLYGCRVVGY